MDCLKCGSKNAGFYNSTCFSCGNEHLKKGEFFIHEYWYMDRAVPYRSGDLDVLEQKIYFKVISKKPLGWT